MNSMKLRFCFHSLPFHKTVTTGQELNHVRDIVQFLKAKIDTDLLELGIIDAFDPSNIVCGI